MVAAAGDRGAELPGSTRALVRDRHVEQAGGPRAAGRARDAGRPRCGSGRYPLDEQAQRAAVTRELGRRERVSQLKAPHELLAILDKGGALDPQRLRRGTGGCGGGPWNQQRREHRDDQRPGGSDRAGPSPPPGHLPLPPVVTTRRSCVPTPIVRPSAASTVTAKRSFRFSTISSRRARAVQRVPRPAAPTCLTHTSNPTVACPSPSRG